MIRVVEHVLTMVVVVTASVLLGFAIAAPRPQPDPMPFCGDQEMQERMRGIMLEGLNEALRIRVEHLFEVWMKDPTGQPARAKVGIDQSTSAYVHGHNAIAKWQLPSCS